MEAGRTLLLNGKMLTGRDAAHKRIADMLAQRRALPPASTSRNRVIYYVGPVDPVRDEVVGPAGPTTATRMDKFTEMMLAKTGLIAMIGKAERGPVGDRGDPQARAAYLMAVGGAAYLVSKAIRASRVVAFADLGMEAIYEFDVDEDDGRNQTTDTRAWLEGRYDGVVAGGNLTARAAVDEYRYDGPSWSASTRTRSTRTGRARRGGRARSPTPARSART